MKIGGVRNQFLDFVIKMGKVTKTVHIDLYSLLSKQLQITEKELVKLMKEDAVDLQLHDGEILPEGTNTLGIMVGEGAKVKDKFGA